MRDVARRFNSRYGEEILVVPEHRIPAVGARIMDLQDPTKKMSTTAPSDEGVIRVLDNPKVIEKKIRRAVTDPDDPPRIVGGPDKPGVTNLIDILAVARGTTPDAVEAEMAGARGYGDLKAAVAEAVVGMLAPVRERYDALRADEEGLERTLAQGAQKARALAEPVLADVRRVMGFPPTLPPTLPPTPAPPPG
jgi:tryptophanyl-tRNA synthetase